MTISSFSNELIITHFNIFFNLKIIEKYVGLRQILCSFKFKKEKATAPFRKSVAVRDTWSTLQ